MKRLVVSFLGASAVLAAISAYGQISLPWPGPGYAPPLACTPNTDGGGTFANVQALFHFDGNGNDSSSNGRNLTITGTSSYSGAQFKFGGFSYQGAASSYAKFGGTPPNIAGDATIELWSYWTATSGQSVFGAYPTFLWYSNVVASSGQEMSGPSNSPVRTYAPLPPLNAWHHWAWVRASGVWTFYIDGAAQTMTGTNWTTNLGDGTTAWYVGWNTAAFYLDHGFVDELRVSNIARYTANFTPQIAAFCNN